MNKIEYKALLPQYKEFSSESEFTKSRDNAWSINNKKREPSIDSNPNKSVDPTDNKAIAGLANALI